MAIILLCLYKAVDFGLLFFKPIFALLGAFYVRVGEMLAYRIHIQLPLFIVLGHILLSALTGHSRTSENSQRYLDEVGIKCAMTKSTRLDCKNLCILLHACVWARRSEVTLCAICCVQLRILFNYSYAIWIEEQSCACVCCMNGFSYVFVWQAKRNAPQWRDDKQWCCAVSAIYFIVYSSIP